jgi:general secretion pathway protein G
MIMLPANQSFGHSYRGGGFTLIELLITVAIVGILSSIALPMSELVVQRNKEQELRSSLRQIRDAIDAYKQAADEGRIAKSIGQSGYPRSLEDLVAGVDTVNDPQKRKIFFLRRIPRDPFVQDADKLPEQTWGKRSYQSRPDAPQEGEDIFDVYTLSTGTGLSGIPYREW